MTAPSIVFLAANAAFVLAFAACVLSGLRIRSLGPYLLAMYILAYADVVLVLQGAGLINALTGPVVMWLQVLLTAGAGLLWLRLGRPTPLAPVFAFSVRWRRRDWRFALQAILLIIMGVAVAYMYALRVGIILATHPSNYDALTYHLTRVGYWLQYQSFYPWPTLNLRQTTFPMNAELGVLWTVLWWGSDRLSGFVQWLSVPVIMLGIYGLARLLGYSRWPSAMGALLWATLPQTLYQSSTTQNDLVTASFWVAGVYFLFLGMRAKKPIPLYLSGICVGLAIGTKSTSLIALPGLTLMALAILWAMRWRNWAWRLLGRWALACAVGVLLFGSYVYIQNTVAFGNPLGASSPRTGPQALRAERGVWTFAARLRDNLGRYAYQLVDFSPLPKPIPEDLNTGKAVFFGSLFQRLGVKHENRENIALSHFDLDFINGFDENSSWFGPVAILLLGAVALQAVRGLRRRDAFRLGLVLMFLAFLVVHSALQKWTPYKGRYYLLPISVSFPLICLLLVPRSAWRTALAVLVLVLGAAVMFTVTQDEVRRDGIAWRRAFMAERQEPTWTGEYSFALIDRTVPAHASIGLEGGIDYTDYMFFGEEYTRYVTLALPEDALLLPRTDLGRFLEDFQNSDYLFLRPDGTPPIRDLTAREFSLLSDDGSNSLWIRNDLRSLDDCDGDRWPFTDFFRSSSPVICPRFPLFPGLPEAGEGDVIRLRGGMLVPNIGKGASGTFGFDLLVQEATEVTLSMDVVPETGQAAHLLRLVLTGPDGEVHAFDRSFSQRKTLQFPLGLVPGTYRLECRLMEGPSQVRLRRIEITQP